MQTLLWILWLLFGRGAGVDVPADRLVAWNSTHQPTHQPRETPVCNRYENLTTVESARKGSDSALRLAADTSYGHDSFARVTVGTVRRAESIELDRTGAQQLRDTLAAMLAAQDAVDAAWSADPTANPLPYVDAVRDSGNSVLIEQVDSELRYQAELAQVDNVSEDLYV